MDVHLPLPLLGGLSPRQFMKRHWQRKPLLVRGAVPGLQPLLGRSGLFALAARDEVESRLVEQRAGGRWTLRRGPFARRALPPLSRPGWTLLVQGVDLHLDAAHELMQRFRFVPQARLDDLMISYATDGGGVGPHFDSYDVFLLQVQGRRRWRIGRQQDLSLQEGVPLKILAAFEPEEEHVLEPGDMLYLPPRYAHDGIAEGECQTYSIGFRSPQRAELARELLLRLAEEEAGSAGEAVYRDPGQSAVRGSRRDPGRVAALRAGRPAQGVEGPAGAAARARRVPERAQARRLVRGRGGVAAGVALGALGPPHPHAVRRSPPVHQRRELACVGAGCAPDAQAGRRAPARRGRTDPRQRRGLAAAGRLVRGRVGARGRGMSDSPALPQGRFEGRQAFAQLVRDALACAAREGWREIILSDPGFADWPLGERAVAQSLQAWSAGGRRCVLLARRYDEVPRRHARFVTGARPGRTSSGRVPARRRTKGRSPARSGARAG